MKRYVTLRVIIVVLALAILPAAASGCGGETPAATDTAPAVAASPSPEASPTRAPTEAPPAETEPAPSTMSEPTATDTAQPAPTDTPQTTPTDAPQVTPTDTPQPTATTQSTDTPQPAATTAPRPDPAALRLALEEVTGGLETPVGIAHAGDGSGRLFILEKAGRIRIVRDGALLGGAFLDITDRVGAQGSEQGLLGLAFHPDYVNNGRFFVNYTDRQGNTVVSRFRVSDGDPNQGNPASEALVLQVTQPAGNHNGGHLAFGPDGYLYVGLGDGGGAGDRYGNGQNGATLLGAMLRLNVDGGDGYAVPPDNPFTGNPGVRDEIWAIGLRNPWRYSFDRDTGDLYIGDVGQNVYEEVDLQPASSGGGQNYGWPIMEGLHCYPADSACSQQGLTLPVFEYDHADGCSVTGGYVYRGQRFPALQGIYLLGDYCSGRIWGLSRAADGSWQAAEMAQVPMQIASFGEDEAGEVYLVDMGGGGLYRVAIAP